MKSLPSDHEKYDFIVGTISRYWRKQISILTFEDDGINGQSFGTWQKKFIAISDGALKKLDEKQLEALLLHEIHHIISGDNWKASIPRAILLFSIIPEGILLAIGSPTWLIAQGKTYWFNILLWPIAYLGVVMASLGTLYIFRLKEFLADNFVLQEMRERNSLVALFLMIDMQKKSTLNKVKFLRTPNISLFAFHPTGISRIIILNEPIKFARAEYRNLAVYIGMILATITSYSGDIKLALNLTLPLYLLLGSLFTFFLSLDNPDSDNKVNKPFHTAKIIYSSILSTGVTSLLLTLPWSIFFITSTSFKVGTMDFSTAEFTSKYEAMHFANLLIDNVAILLLAGSAMIVFMFTLQMLVKWNNLNLLAITFWLIWLPLAISISFLWIKYLGDYDVVLLKTILPISFGISWLLALLLFFNQYLKKRTRISMND